MHSYIPTALIDLWTGCEGLANSLDPRPLPLVARQTGGLQTGIEAYLVVGGANSLVPSDGHSSHRLRCSDSVYHRSLLLWHVSSSS